MVAHATFDTLEVRRPTLADTYLQLLDAQPGRPLALFAPRRVGKTFFLENDLAPAAAAAGFLAVYADVWLHRTAPLEAINHALEEALDDVTIPAGPVGRLAKTPVKKVGAFGASVEVGDAPARRKLPDAPELRFDALAGRLADASKRRILLMLDEVQALGEGPHGGATAATLRAVLQKRKRQIAAVFTGSSQDALAAMMAAAGGPMYQFAQLLDFPTLDDAYLKLLAQHFSRVHRGKRLDLAALRRVFAQIGFKPALMKDLVKSMSAEGMTDVDLALRRFMQDDRQLAGWRALLDAAQPFERALLLLIAQGHAPLGRDALAQLASIKRFAPTIAKVRTALERLRKAGILTKPASGGYAIEDRLFADYLATMRLTDVV